MKLDTLSFASACQEALYKNLDLPLKNEAGTIYGATLCPHPLLNGIVRCQTKEEDLARVVDHVDAYFQNKKLPYSWWVASHEAPSTLPSLLEKKGFMAFGKCPLLVADLNNQNFASPSLQILQVQEEQDQSLWMNLLQQAFQISQEAAAIFQPLMQNAKAFTHVLAMDRQEAVATASLTFTPEGAYICSDSSRGERKKIYTKEMALGLIQLAKQENSPRLAVISAPDDVEAYLEAGFVEVGAMDVYVRS